MSGFCSLLFRFLSVRCEAVVISQGSVFIFWSVEPFTTRPVFGFYLPVFFFFLYGLFVDAVCSRSLSLSLSLSLSGAGEPQTFLVWGSPCVSSTWTRSPPSIRTSSSSPTPRHCPAPVFFFFSSSSLVPGSVFARPGSVGVGFLGGCFFFLCLWSLFSSVRCTARQT